MFCSQCGNALEEHYRYCSRCGRATEATSRPEPPENTLSRPREGRKIAGVCAGIARYLDIDVTLVRVLWVLLIIFPPPGLLLYIICWIVMPEDPLPVSQPTATTISRAP